MVVTSNGMKDARCGLEREKPVKKALAFALGVQLQSPRLESTRPTTRCNLHRRREQIMRKSIILSRNSINGQFVTPAYRKAHPKTTEREIRPIQPKPKKRG